MERFGVTREWVAGELSKGFALHHIYQGLNYQENGGDYEAYLKDLYPDRELTAREKFELEFSSSVIESVYGEEALSVSKDVYQNNVRPQSYYEYDKIALQHAPLKFDQAPYSIGDDYGNISTVDGSLTMRETDFVLPGANGLDFALTRAYDSSRGKDEIYVDENYGTNSTRTPRDEEIFWLGKGWIWDISYVDISGWTPTVYVAGLGKFASNGSGLLGLPYNYIDFGPAPSHIVLSNGSQAEYMLVDYSQGTFQYFDNSGLLQEIRDENGNKIVFLYNYAHPTYGLVLETVMTVTNDDRHRNHMSFIYRGKQSIEVYVGNNQVVRYNKGTITANGRQKEVLSEVIDSIGRSTKYDYNVLGFSPFNLRQDYQGFTGTDRLLYWGKQDWVYLSLVEHPTKAMTSYSIFSSDSNIGPYAVEYQLRYTERNTFYSSDTFTENRILGIAFNGNYLGPYGRDTTFDIRTRDGRYTTIYSYKKDHRDEWRPDVFYLTKTETYPENNSSLKKVTTYTYDEGTGRAEPIEIVERNYRGTETSAARITRRTYDEWGFMTSETNPLGVTQTNRYNPVSINNRMVMTQQVTPINANESLTTDFRYDLNNGNLLSVSSKNRIGNILGQVQYGYDSIGNPIHITIKGTQKDTSIQQEFSPTYKSMFPSSQTVNITDADGVAQQNTTRMTYDPLTGYELSFSDGNFNTTTYQYDRLGRVTAEVYADGTQTTVQYNDSQNSVSVTDPSGVHTLYMYTALGRLYKEVTGRGSVEYVYDKYGLLLRKFDGKGSILVSYSYDEWGRLVQENYYTITKRYEYDEIANTKTIIDGEGNTIRESFDSLDRLIQIEEIRSTGNVILERYVYDYAGNVTSHTDANGNVTKYDYDAMNRLTSVSDAEQKTITYTYDLSGNIVTVLYPDGQKISKRYDEISRLLEQTDPLGKSERYYYDGNDNIIKHVDRKEQIHNFKYNHHNLRIQDSTVDEEVTYTYDPAGKRTSMMDGTGTTTYSYFSTGELKTIRYPDGASLNFDYEERGLRTNQTFTSGSFLLTMNQTYNRTTPLPVTMTITNGAGNDISSFNYTYKRNGLLSQLNRGLLLSEINIYDGLNLSGVHQQTNSNTTGYYEYGYDNNRNITQKVENGVTSNFTYDVLNRIRTSSVNDESYAYDVRNNRSEMSSNKLPNIHTAEYTYDQRNRLAVAITDKGEVSYRYNGDGLMVNRTTNGVTTRYYYDDRGLLVAEGTVSSDGNVTITAGYIFDSEGRLLGRQVSREGEFQYYITNAHGDITEIRDASGNLLNRYTYDIWGNPIVEEETVSNNFRYSGEYWDPVTDLQYLRARWYDPTTARFIGEDPYEGELENPLSQNLYTYVENNPLTYVDPTGNSKASVKSCMLLCFAAGTIIETQEGPKAIEEIEVGDYVLAQSEDTGGLAYKPVEEIFNRVTEETYHIQVEDTVIVTTAEHPFWVIGKGWVESRDLKAGDWLVNDEGKEYAIEKIEAKQETIRVYNFSVGDYHTYFVTGLKLWTHNCSMGGGARGAGGPGGSGGYVPRPGGGGGNSLPKKVTSPKQQKKIVVDLPKLSKQLQKGIAQFQKNRAKGTGNSFQWTGKNFSQMGKSASPNEMISNLEKSGWTKTIEPGGKKSGPATILTDPSTGTKVRVHAEPGEGTPYFRVQNKGGGYLDDNGVFPSNATKQELRDATHFYFEK